MADKPVTRRLVITRDGIDISDECELKNGKANPFGWSQYEIWDMNQRIGWLESGEPMHMAEGYTATIVEINSELPP